MTAQLNANQAKRFLLLEGMVAVSIQFLFLRQVTPFVGSSTVITSIVITLFLAALAAGYEFGGAIRADHQRRLRDNLSIASLLLGFGGSLIAAEMAFRLLPFHPLANLVIYLIIFMVPATFLVAQTVPLLINFTDESSASHKAGSALLWSTIGNVIGGLITTMIIMYYLSAGWAISINAMALALLSIRLREQKRSLAPIYLLAAMLGVMLFNVGYEQQTYIKNNAYANYQVVPANEGKYFVSNGVAQSYLDDKNRSNEYIEHIRASIQAGNKLRDKNILVIGAGGFTLSHGQEQDRNHYTYVDIDSQIDDIAKTHFLPGGKINGDFVAQDGRAFLMQTDRQFDVIVIDTFSNRVDIPWHLSTQEFFRLVRSKLTVRGLLYVNLIASLHMQDSYSKNMDVTIRSVFPNCHNSLLLHTNKGERLTDYSLVNVIYSCSIDDNEGDVRAYVDSDNKATMDNFYLKSVKAATP